MSGIYDNNNLGIIKNVWNDIRGMSLNLKNISLSDSPYSILTDDNIILVNAISGNVSINLYKENKYDHPTFIIKKIDNSPNLVKVYPGDAGTTIESASVYNIDQPGEVSQFIFDKNNSNWIRITHDLTYSAELTSKGDILSHSGTIEAVLSVGTNNQVMVADSTQIVGIKWATLKSNMIEH